MKDAGCGWEGASKALTNGYLYADPGHVEELGGTGHAITSVWNVGFYRGEREEALVVGYLDSTVASGRSRRDV